MQSQQAFIVHYSQVAEGDDVFQLTCWVQNQQPVIVQDILNILWIIITVPSHVIRDISSQSSYAPSGHRMSLDTRVIGEAETEVPHTLQEPLGPTGPTVTLSFIVCILKHTVFIHVNSQICLTIRHSSRTQSKAFKQQKLRYFNIRNPRVLSHRNIFSFYFRLVFLLYVYGDTSHTHVEIRL